MAFSNMTLEELARHIGMDAREVRKWAERGKLPGQKIGGEWRFNRAHMLDWLQREMHTLGDEHIRNLERATSSTEAAGGVGALLAPQAVELNLPARSRSSVLRELVVVAERTGLVYDAEGIREALEQREALGSTGLAGGIAFPHPRRPMPYATAEPLICLARVPAGIPFGAPDGRVTDLFVLVVSHEERQHLCTLARLSLLFQDGTLAREVREAESVDEALTALVRHEQALVKRSQ